MAATNLFFRGTTLTNRVEQVDATNYTFGFSVTRGSRIRSGFSPAQLCTDQTQPFLVVGLVVASALLGGAGYYTYNSFYDNDDQTVALEQLKIDSRGFRTASIPARTSPDQENTALARPSCGMPTGCWRPSRTSPLRRRLQCRAGARGGPVAPRCHQRLRRAAAQV